MGFSFLLSFLWASILILAVRYYRGSSLLLSSVFRVEDGVGPDRPAIKVVGVVDQVLHWFVGWDVHQNRPLRVRFLHLEDCLLEQSGLIVLVFLKA